MPDALGSMEGKSSQRPRRLTEEAKCCSVDSAEPDRGVYLKNGHRKGHEANLVMFYL